MTVGCGSGQTDIWLIRSLTVLESTSARHDESDAEGIRGMSLSHLLLSTSGCCGLTSACCWLRKQMGSRPRICVDIGFAEVTGGGGAWGCGESRLIDKVNNC